MFSLACIINNRHISSHKMASVGFDPHLVNDTSLLSLPLGHLLVVGRLAQPIHLNLFSLACIINIWHISSHKMASVGLEPHLAHDTSLLSLPLARPLARCWKTSATYYINMFSLACIINNRHISSHKMASVGFDPHLVHDTSLLSLPLDHMLVGGSLPQLIHLIFFSSIYN
jgi:hypothetical protein